jgi:hypothetical protein
MTPDLKALPTPGLHAAISEKWRICDQLGEAIDTGPLGEIVSKHEKLILDYYKDVLEQAQKSFASAKAVAKVGFGVLIVTVAYLLVIDALSHMVIPGVKVTEPSIKVGGIGIVSGALIEFIAGVNFVLYARASKQFSAFHICLERTHRYLLAYKIAEGIGGDRDQTLKELVCIMANAPMITGPAAELPGGAAVSQKSGFKPFAAGAAGS